MKKILVFICLALCALMLVCSCGGENTDTSSDTGSNTDSSKDSVVDSTVDSSKDEESYRALVCDKDGNPIANVIVNYCQGENCSFGVTGKDGYVTIPSADYHVTGVSSAGATGYVFPEEVEIYFENGSKLITIVLEKE